MQSNTNSKSPQNGNAEHQYDVDGMIKKIKNTFQELEKAASDDVFTKYDKYQYLNTYTKTKLKAELDEISRINMNYRSLNKILRQIELHKIYEKISEKDKIVMKEWWVNNIRFTKKDFEIYFNLVNEVPELLKQPGFWLLKYGTSPLIVVKHPEFGPIYSNKKNIGTYLKSKLRNSPTAKNELNSMKSSDRRDSFLVVKTLFKGMEIQLSERYDFTHEELGLEKPKLFSR